MDIFADQKRLNPKLSMVKTKQKPKCSQVSNPNVHRSQKSAALGNSGIESEDAAKTRKNVESLVKKA